MELLHPRRPARSEIRATLPATATADEAWRALVDTGRLPSSWLDDPRRRFILGGDTRDPAFAPTGAHPDDVDGCALVAADVAGLLAAEAGARVFADALAPWSAPAFDHVRWWLMPRERYAYAMTDTRPGVSYAPAIAIGALHRAARGTGVEVPPQPFGHAAEYAAAWRALAARGGSINDRAGTALSLAVTANPFDGLAAIEGAGYAGLEWLTVDGGVVLVAPR